jgi:hypothetical protein
MPEPLDGAWAKVFRAQEHLTALAGAVDTYFASHPYTLEGTFDATTSDWVVRIRVATHPPIKLGTIVGDVVHNQRSALDYLVYELARLATRKDRPRGTQFPIIATNPKDYRQSGLHRVAMLDPQVRKVIRLLQPYHSAAPEDHPLTLLNRLSNADKHRLLVPTIGYVGGASYRFEMHEGVTGIQTVQPSFGTLEDGSEVVRVRIVADSATPDMRVGGDFAFDLAFRDPEVSVVGALAESLFEVASILNWFTPLFGPVRRV